MFISNAAFAKTINCTPIAEINCSTCDAQIFVECEKSNLFYEGHIANASKISAIELLITNVTTGEEKKLSLSNPPDSISEYRFSIVMDNSWIKKQLSKNKIKLSDHTVVDLLNFEIKAPITLYQDAWMTTPVTPPQGF